MRFNDFRWGKPCPIAHTTYYFPSLDFQCLIMPNDDGSRTEGQLLPTTS